MYINKNLNNSVHYTSFLFFIFALYFLSCSDERKTNTQSSFSIAFLTDIHLGLELNSIQGFMQAIENVNTRNPDFVLSGGDLISDALGVKYERADSLYNLYQEISSNFKMPLYNTIGNHDLYGINIKSETDSLNPEYGLKMFEKRLGNTYYSFEHKGWKFMILNSIKETNKFGATNNGRFPASYIGMIDKKQVDWIKTELAQTDSVKPIVISTHIPFITVYTQKYFGTTIPNDSSQIVVNGKEIIDLFKGHNLKLVLQGHLHSVEDIYVDGVHFIQGGAVSGAWWRGPSPTGFEKGYLFITFEGEQFSWEYVDYGLSAN